jgi:Bax protein
MAGFHTPLRPSGPIFAGSTAGLREAVVRLVALTLPPAAAAVLAAHGLVHRLPPEQWGQPLRTVNVPDMRQAERMFDRLDFDWPPRADATIPRIALGTLPKDLAAADDDPARKKSVFLRTLLPIVLAENERIRYQREYVVSRIASGLPLPGSPARRALRELLHEYGLDGTLDQTETRNELLLRLDEVPPGLVLAQAAIESGWGSSRFARLANNLFGIWTFRDGMGVVPRARADDERHTVRWYPSIRASVRSYLHNLNVGHAYEDFRVRRAEMRRSGETLSSLELIPSLTRYSARGDQYIRELRSIIVANRLQRLDGIELRGSHVQLVDGVLTADETTGG